MEFYPAFARLGRRVVLDHQSLLTAMKSDRINISIFFAALGGLVFGTCLAIAGMHREFAAVMLVDGLFVASFAGRIAAAQHVLANRPQFPNHWKRSKPLQFMLSGAGIVVLGMVGLMRP
jgi:hypothetical protein